MQQNTADLLKRLAIALIGQGLPQITVLSVMARHFKKGSFYLVVSALLVSAFLIANFYALYQYLLWQGFSTLESFLMVDILVLLCIIFAKMRAYKHFTHIFPKHHCKTKHYCPEENLVAGIMEAFVEGLQEKRCSCQKEVCDCPKP